MERGNLLGTIDPGNQILSSAASTHRCGILKVPASVPTSFPRMLSGVAQKPAVSVSSFLVWTVRHVRHGAHDGCGLECGGFDWHRRPGTMLGVEKAQFHLQSSASPGVGLAVTPGE